MKSSGSQLVEKQAKSGAKEVKSVANGNKTGQNSEKGRQFYAYFKRIHFSGTYRITALRNRVARRSACGKSSRNSRNGVQGGVVRGVAGYISYKPFG